jgi:hypothetical protein
MKHLKTFESYETKTNEGLKDIKGKVSKFATGYASKEEKKKAEDAFMKELEEMEKKAEKAGEDFVFDKASLLKQAKENKFLGKLEERTSRKDGRTFVVYVGGKTGFGELASGAKHSTNQNR